MRKFFSAVSKFFSPVTKVVRRVFSAISKVLRKVSIALSGATNSFVGMALTLAAVVAGLPYLALVFATMTSMAMWGTIFYRDAEEQEKLRTGLYLIRIACMLIDIFGAASSVRDSRRSRSRVQDHGHYGAVYAN